MWDGGPTPAGEGLLELASPMLAAADAVQASMKGAAAAPPAAPRRPARKVTPTQLRVAMKIAEQCDEDGVLRADDAAIGLTIGSAPATVRRAIDILEEAGAVARLADRSGVRVMGWMRARGPLKRLARGETLVAGMPVARVPGGPVGVLVRVDWAHLRCSVRWPRKLADMKIESLMRGFGRVGAEDIVLPRWPAEEDSGARAIAARIEEGGAR